MAKHTITAALIASVTSCQLGVGENMRRKRAQTDRPRDQNCRSGFFGNKPRRIISALIGPGGQATDQPV